MADMEKVIEGLETMLSNYDLLDEIEINKGNQMLLMHRAIAKAALELLKEQEAVVRCKDCKYYHKPEFGYTFGDCTYASAWYQTNTDDYCSKGKRRET